MVFFFLTVNLEYFGAEMNDNWVLSLNDLTKRLHLLRLPFIFLFFLFSLSISACFG